MSDIDDNRHEHTTSEQYASTGWSRANQHTACWVNDRDGHKRPGAIWGFSGPNEAPTGYYVHYTNVERPTFIVNINMREYPVGYSDYYAAQDVTFE